MPLSLFRRLARPLALGALLAVVTVTWWRHEAGRIAYGDTPPSPTTPRLASSAPTETNSTATLVPDASLPVDYAAYQSADAVPLSDVPTALNQLTSPQLEGRFASRLFSRWVHEAPLSALQWAIAFPRAHVPESYVKLAAATFASHASAEALAWIEAQPPGPWLDTMRVAIATETSRGDPLSTLRLALTMPTGLERDQVGAHAFSRWSEEDPAEALLFLGQLPPGDFRDQMQSELNPYPRSPVDRLDDIIESLAHFLLDPSARDDAYAALSVTWATRDPHSARSLARAIQEPTTRETTLNFIDEVLSRDPRPGP